MYYIYTDTSANVSINHKDEIERLVDDGYDMDRLTIES